MFHMKYISWNVNGFRAWKEKPGAIEFLHQENPDAICFQETKAQPEQILDDAKKLFSEYPHHYFNSAVKKGYSGVAILSKIEPKQVTYGIEGLALADEEGRVLTAEYADHFLVTVYTPNSKPDLARVDYRHQEWDVQFLKYLKKLEKKKPVVVCGDLNAAHQEIDIKNATSNKTTPKSPGTAGFTDKEREGFENYLQAGFIDTFRFLKPDTVKYSWWSYKFNAKANNAGWRIDYFLTSKSLEKRILEAEIHDTVLGSDHCPVSLTFK